METFLFLNKNKKYSKQHFLFFCIKLEKIRDYYNLSNFN